MRARWLILIFYVIRMSVSAQEPATTAATAGEAPLPAMRELLLALDKNQKAAEEQAREYTYHVHVEEEELSGKGQVKKTTITDSESLTIGGVRVNRVVARNGKPLSGDEKHKEDERIDKQVAKIKARLQKREDKGEESNSRGDAVIPASRILELGKFTNARREMLDGRSAIVMDYAGDPTAKTRNTSEGVIRDLVGRVWVDEEDRVLMRGEGHFLNDFKVGGGLIANVHKGSHFDFRATKVNGEAWLPAEINGEGSVRFLLFSGFNGRMHLTASDYRRFRTGVTIMPGSHVVDENGAPVVQPHSHLQH